MRPPSHTLRATRPPSLRPTQPQPCSPTPRRRAPRRPSALLSDPALSLVDGLLAAGVVAGLALSAAPLVTGASARRVAAARDAADAARACGEGADAAADEEDADVKWGVMSVVACVPLLNWTAWIFGAIDDPTRAPVYMAFAALYAAAAARHGFSLDASALAAVAACALHVQLERAAAVEVVRLSLPGDGSAAGALGAAARGAAGAADAAADAAAALGAAVRAGLDDGGGDRGYESDSESGAMSDAGRRALPADGRQPAPRRRRRKEGDGDDDDGQQLDAALLQAFDERMQAREKEREKEEQ